jgi:hypothetical protein
VIGPKEIVELTAEEAVTLKLGSWEPSTWSRQFARCFDVDWSDFSGLPGITRSAIGDASLKHYESVHGPIQPKSTTPSMGEQSAAWVGNDLAGDIVVQRADLGLLLYLLESAVRGDEIVLQPDGVVGQLLKRPRKSEVVE